MSTQPPDDIEGVIINPGRETPAAAQGAAQDKTDGSKTAPRNPDQGGGLGADDDTSELLHEDPLSA